MNLDNYSTDSQIGCFLEYELDYPDELHNFYNCLLAGEKLKVTKELLAECQSIRVVSVTNAEHNFFLGKNIISNLDNKKIQNLLLKLKTIFKFRVTIKRNYRLLEFKQ